MKLTVLVLMTVAAVAGAQSCTFRNTPDLNSFIVTGVEIRRLNNTELQAECAEACCVEDRCNWYVYNANDRECQLWESAEQRDLMPGFVSAEKGMPNPTQPIPTQDASTSGPMVITFVLSLAVSLLLYANDVLM